MTTLMIFSIVISFLNAYLPLISHRIFSSINKQENKSKYKDEIDQLKAEMNSTPMQDEFPKYARLQRRLNKLIEERRSEERANASSQLKTSLIVSYGLQFLMTMVSLTLFWLYRSSPVLYLPGDWIYPLDNVLSWPTHIHGAISFPVWFLITNSVAKIIVGT